MKKIRAVALKRPCSNCPFLDSENSIAHTLCEGRVDGIKADLLADDMTGFICHKTSSGIEDDDGDYRHSGKESQCMGAMAWMYNQRRFNVLMRIAAMDDEWLENLKASAELVTK